MILLLVAAGLHREIRRQFFRGQFPPQVPREPGGRFQLTTDNGPSTIGFTRTVSESDCLGLRSMTNVLEIGVEQLRGVWAERQGLAEPLAGGVSGVVGRCGWMNSAGSSVPYVALRARIPGCTRSDVDLEVFESESIIEAFAVRACTMLLPREDLPLALASAHRALAPHFEKVYQTCPVTERDVKVLSEVLVRVLQEEALTLEAIRDSVPQQLVRSLGNPGKQLGESTTLSFALRNLRVDGVVQRVPADRRLDSDRFTFKLLPHDIAQEVAQLRGDETLVMELCRRFFRWASPATIKEFAWWAGTNQKEAQKAMKALRLAQAKVREWSETVWFFEDDTAKLRKPPHLKPDAITLLPFRDNYLYFRRGLAVFVRPEDQGAEVLDWRGRPARIAEMENIHNNAIVAGGRLVGVWEYDPEEEEIVWKTFNGVPVFLQRILAAKIEELENFVRNQLGDVQFYGMDTGLKRRQRIARLRSGGSLSH